MARRRNTRLYSLQQLTGTWLSRPSNRGEVLDTQLAATPQEANRVAIMMLASRDVFDIGDVLICLRADGDNPHGQVPSISSRR
jgi:hypothetical protein